MVGYTQLKEELLRVLDGHIDLLKDVETIDPKHLDGIVFMMHSFGFMLDRAPKVLATEDEEDMHYMMFQYYSLLSELKYNLAMNYSYATLAGKKLSEIVDTFPKTYEKELRQWWEQKTGLEVEETKQTISIPAFE
ncbi:hypothetical protein BAU15_08345 [Enterococcus sp. JM4C]|uniref:hypothetical protein n=1 Tax=Candidatus Enterococcus huntleyi TaxID=1857217 RepID=UPI00137A548B|nr:hypothetical protein [Enterococcus sp. JM4C]KAF1297905.1 hypothetical protein BAU15_08345 [Enterococcus sp. JM4C]